MINWIYTLIRVVPKKIKIKRIQDYHTHYVGSCSNNNLFWGYITYHLNKDHTKAHFAVVHFFAKNGNYLESKWHSAVGNDALTSNEIWLKLEELIKAIEPVKYHDITIRTFKTEIEGILFGLIPDKKFCTIDLEPSSTISFTPPWLGYYDT